MVKRITISVADELFEKMEKWKGSFNVSKECQKHLTNLLNKKEKYAAKVKDLTQEDTLERLKKEKMELERSLQNKYEELGKEKCLEWIKSAHYEEILFARKWGQNINNLWETGKDISELRPCSDTMEGENLFNHLDEIIKKDTYLSWDEHSTSLFTFIENWIVTLNNFCKQLEEEIGTLDFEYD